MLMPVLAGLVVSVDAFFIGLSLGLQERCRFVYLAVINAFLLGLCVLGFWFAEWFYAFIGFDTDLVVGLLFIALGLFYIAHYFISAYAKRRRKKTAPEAENAHKTIILIGVIMSVEALLITMGITLVFSTGATLLIPITVGAAHFGYSAVSFWLSKSKAARLIPVTLRHVFSGFALVVYGLMALFVEWGGA